MIDRTGGPRHVAVIGGGITGLVAARTLARAGVTVTVLEATERLGGQVRTVLFDGRRVDVGAEALHRGIPPVAQLLDELALTDALVDARPGSAWLWTSHGLHPLPAGVGPSGPTRLGPVLRARILSPAGLARAAIEPLLPRTAVSPDIGVGTYLAARFGRQVRDRLVDPVLGSLHAGAVDRLSLHATAPQLAAQAVQHRSLLLAHRARSKGGPPKFATFRGGLSVLVDALASDSAITVRTSTPVMAISCGTGGYLVDIGDDEPLRVDGVVLAVPARVAHRLLSTIAPRAAAPLDAYESVSVATVLAAYPRSAVEGLQAFAGTGLLVPSPAGRLLKAATFLSRKWEHLDDGEHFVVRLSAGRAGGPDVTELDDVELVHGLHTDLAEATGVASSPVLTHVQRWPEAMAQLEVGHLSRLAETRAALEAFPGLFLAGAPYDGLGIASCIASGRRAATALLDRSDRDEVLAR
jgi:oxygen-dependent protoporphyrinogen oxidase